MISFFNYRAAQIRWLWVLNTLRCQTTHKVKLITYQTIPGSKAGFLVKIAVAPPNESETFAFSGMSTSNITEAFNKAFNEFLEADFFWKLKLDWRVTRSGFAGGRNQETALRRAYNELVERDAFIQHFFVPTLKSIPLEPLMDSQVRFAKL